MFFVQAIKRSVMIFVVQQPRELIRRRSILLSELFYFEMRRVEMHWAEKHHCRYFSTTITLILLFILQITVYNRLSAKYMIHVVTLICSLCFQVFPFYD